MTLSRASAKSGIYAAPIYIYFRPLLHIFSALTCYYDFFCYYYAYKAGRDTVSRVTRAIRAHLRVATTSARAPRVACSMAHKIARAQARLHMRHDVDYAMGDSAPSAPSPSRYHAVMTKARAGARAARLRITSPAMKRHEVMPLKRCTRARDVKFVPRLSHASLAIGTRAWAIAPAISDTAT